MAIAPVLSLRQRSFLIQLAHTPACLQASMLSPIYSRPPPPQWHCCGVALCKCTVFFVCTCSVSVFLHHDVGHELKISSKSLEDGLPPFGTLFLFVFLTSSVTYEAPSRLYCSMADATAKITLSLKHVMLCGV